MIETHDLDDDSNGDNRSADSGALSPESDTRRQGRAELAIRAVVDSRWAILVFIGALCFFGPLYNIASEFRFVFQRMTEMHVGQLSLKAGTIRVDPATNEILNSLDSESRWRLVIWGSVECWVQGDSTIRPLAKPLVGAKLYEDASSGWPPTCGGQPTTYSILRTPAGERAARALEQGLEELIGEEQVLAIRNATRKCGGRVDGCVQSK